MLRNCAGFDLDQGDLAELIETWDIAQGRQAVCADASLLADRRNGAGLVTEFGRGNDDPVDRRR